jgi:hypothetical protein
VCLLQPMEGETSELQFSEAPLQGAGRFQDHILDIMGSDCFFTEESSVILTFQLAHCYLHDIKEMHVDRARYVFGTQETDAIEVFF